MKIAEYIYDSLEAWYEEHPDHNGPTPDAEAKKREIWSDDRLGQVLPKTMPPPGWVVGHRFGQLDVDNDQLEELWQFHDLYSTFGEYASAPIHWLTKAPGKGELQMAYTAVSTASEALNPT